MRCRDQRQKHLIKSVESISSGRAALTLAISCTAVWFVLIVWLKPAPIGDERTHYPVVEEMTEGQWPQPGRLPMLPAAHLLIAAILKISGPSLLAARAVSAALTICGILVFHAAVRLRQPDAAGSQTLLMIWNPLFLPYCVLVYTEPASMLAIVLGLYLHVRRCTFWAAAALLFACLIRQSNIAWAALMAIWLLIESGEGGPRPIRAATRQWLARAWPYLTLMALFVVACIIWLGRLLAPASDNRAGFNPAQYYLFLFVAAIVYLPLWLETLRQGWHDLFEPRLARAGVCALLVAAVGALVMLYSNPHRWNASTSYLHDRFLVLLHTSVWIRSVVSALIVVAAVALFGFVRQTEHRAMLSAAWIFALLFLAPHGLVDHRYYIFPLLFINFFSRYTPLQRRRLCVWHFMLAGATAAFTIACGGPDSGL